MTQRQIATRIGVRQPSVAMWISGQCVPSEENQKALLAAFGIPVASWPNDWHAVRDSIIDILSKKAPDLLQEIIDEVEKRTRL